MVGGEGEPGTRAAWKAGHQASRAREQDMGNAVVHFEIGGPDDQPLITFYRQLSAGICRRCPAGATR